MSAELVARCEALLAGPVLRTCGAQEAAFALWREVDMAVDAHIGASLCVPQHRKPEGYAETLAALKALRDRLEQRLGDLRAFLEVRAVLEAELGRQLRRAQLTPEQVEAQLDELLRLR